VTVRRSDNPRSRAICRPLAVCVASRVFLAFLNVVGSSAIIVFLENFTSARAAFGRRTLIDSSQPSHRIDRFHLLERLSGLRGDSHVPEADDLVDLLTLEAREHPVQRQSVSVDVRDQTNAHS